MILATALEVSARIWCDQDYSHVVMNPELANLIAVMLMNEANKQEHTIQDDFEHFLSYSGYSNEPEDVKKKLFTAYEANWNQ